TRVQTCALPIWTQLDLLAVHHPRDDLRYADLVELGSELREWYFSGNGLLLSRAATDAFDAVQDALTLALRAVGHDGLHQLLRSKQTTYTLSEVARLELTERSEERRVGKECRSRGLLGHYRRK